MFKTSHLWKKCGLATTGFMLFASLFFGFSSPAAEAAGGAVITYGSISAYGTTFNDKNPIMHLYYRGRLSNIYSVSTYDSSNPFKNNTYKFRIVTDAGSKAPEPKDFRIAFVNDAYIKPGGWNKDRNLFVHQLHLTRAEGNNRQYATRIPNKEGDAYTTGCRHNRGPNLYCNGSIYFRGTF